MVETHSQRSRREAKEALRSLNMSTYEYDGDEFFNFDRNTLLDNDNDNENNENNNGNDDDNEKSSMDSTEV